MFPYGSDTRPLTFHDIRHTFQSTLPRGSDAVHTSDNVALCYFNPRSLTGATALLVCPQPHRQSFQSTLPYESNLNTQSNGGWISEISIHAPLRERPVPPNTLTAATAYFNPRSLTGATHLSQGSCYRSKHFNPRSLTGATPERYTAYHWQKDFNPRSLTGATTWLKRTANKLRNFNPRSLTGATLPLRPLSVQHGDFNPRSLTGATETPACNYYQSLIFQSTLPYGSAPPAGGKLWAYLSQFQSTLPYGSDHPMTLCCPTT